MTVPVPSELPIATEEKFTLKTGEELTVQRVEWSDHIGYHYSTFIKATPRHPNHQVNWAHMIVQTPEEDLGDGRARK